MKTIRFIFIGLIIFLIVGLNQVISGSMESYGVLGTEIFTEPDGSQRMYTKIGLQPQLIFGKLGIGLDIILYLDEQGDVRKADWDEWKRIPEKFLYVRYAEKGDPLYLYFGAMERMILGHGMIFNRYSNLTMYPDVKKKGFALDINFKRFGIETITTNIIRAEVFGSRIYYKPFYDIDVFLLKNIAFGISGGTDINPDNLKATEDDEIVITGLDIEFPLLDVIAFSVTAFADVAEMNLGDVYKSKGAKDKGTGQSVGILGKVLVFDYRMAYRKVENNFIYGYFDVFYEIDRELKPYTIGPNDRPMKEGPFFELGYSLLGKLDIRASYEDFNYDPTDIYPWVHAEASIDPSLLLNKILWKFSYDKRNAKTWDDLTKVKGANTIMKTELGYSVSSSIMIVLIREQTFDYLGRAQTRSKMETRFRF